MKKLLSLLILFLVLFSANDLMAQKSIKKSQMQVGGHLGIALPMGDFGDAANTGFEIGGDFMYYYQPNIAFFGQLAYISFGTESDAVSYSFFNIKGGALYLFNTKGVRPFVGASAGFYNFSYEIEVFGFSSSDSDLNFGIAPLGGVIFPVTPKIDIKAQMEYNIVFSSGDASYLGVNATVLYKL